MCSTAPFCRMLADPPDGCQLEGARVHVTAIRLVLPQKSVSAVATIVEATATSEDVRRVSFLQ